MKLSIVTGNSGKYEQIVSKLSDSFNVQQIDIDIPEIQTNVLTDISADKCRQAYAQVQGPVVVDDTGIYFDAFNDFPGALTKYLYKGIGLEGIQNLYTGIDNKKAHFQTVLGYMDETLEEPKLFVGEIHGTISFDWLQAEGAEHNQHLPYDLIFIPEGYASPAYFNMSVWTQGNARIQAVEKLNAWLLTR